MLRSIGVVVAIAIVALVSPASAQMKSAVTAAELQSILADAGMSVTMIEDAQTGSPVATAQSGAVQFWVRALDCAGAPKSCSTLMFFANFELGRAATPADYQAVNGFNDRQVFGRAYLIPGRNQVGVDYVVELDGGVAPGNISGNVARWVDVIGAFIDHFSAGAATS